MSLTSRLVDLGSVVSSPVGSGTESWPKLNFVQYESQRSHLVARIALNFNSKQRLSLIFENNF